MIQFPNQTMKMIFADVFNGRKRFVAAFFLSFLFLSLEAPAAPADLPPGFPEVALKKRTRGEEAITALGNKLPAVAAYYKKTEAELKKLLREDKMLWVDEHGRLLYICVFDVPHDADEELAADVSPIDNGPVDRTQTFLLHSRKGSSKVAYLDFDGHDASATSWGQDAIGVPFDLDGNESNFNTTERDRIQYIWQRVAEDFAMYDIDVTTEDPGIEALRKTSTSDNNYGIRVVIAGASGDWYGSAGGVAYLNSFDSSTDLPCWVFPGSLSSSEKNIAEATSHEIGHTLALSHDGKTDGTSYYTGHGNWAPIMGVGYSKPIVQWSKGEYAFANNLEDDLIKMQNEGIVFRTDDFPSTIGGATGLRGVSFSTNGVIERNTDVDFFRFQTGGGRVVITATPSPRGPNLHVYLKLYDLSGNLAATAYVDDSASGVLPATITTTLPLGTYAFSVEGIGEGVAFNTGYSDYSSLGQYTVTGAIVPDTSWIPTAGGTYSWTNSANWLSNNIPWAEGVVARVNNNIVGDQIVTLNTMVDLGTLVIGDSDGTHGFTFPDDGSIRFSAVSGNASLIKTSGSNDVFDANLQLTSSLVVSNSSAGNLKVRFMFGPGGLIKTGSGNLLLQGAQDYVGTTLVAAGTLQLSAVASVRLTPKIQLLEGAIFDASALFFGLTVVSNQTLSGSGLVKGKVIAGKGASISPGDVVAGTLSLSNNLVLSNGVSLNFDLANSPGVGGGTNDLLIVAGDLSLNGAITLNFNFLNNFPASPGSYTLIRYGGALLGSASNLIISNLSTRFAFSIDASVPGEIRLNVFGAPGSLVWKGDSLLNQWDLTNTNWQIGGTPGSFANLDDVLFDDTGSEFPGLNLVTTLKPNSITVAGAKNYTLSGAGKMSGATGLNKTGSGTLMLNTSNDFNGGVVISGGTLKTGNATALGSVAGSTTVASGGRLDINAQNLGSEVISVSGSGLSGTGALINSSGTAQTNALRFVTLSADATFGGSGRFDVRANPTATFTGNNFALTKTGVNEIWLVDVGATGFGDINVNQGLFGVQGSTTLGNATNTLTAAAGSRIGIWNSDINLLNKKWVLNGATVQSLSGNNAITGTMTLNATNVFSSVSIFQVQSVISGTGSLVKTGNGSLTLAGANSFTGELVVSNGTLIAGSTTALGNTLGSTIIANDARLDLNGLNLGVEPIIAQGNGLGNAGAIVNSGTSQTSALRFITLSNNTTFGGINRWDLRANPTGNLIGNNFALTKAGVNTIYLVDLGNTGLGNITVSEGTLGVQGTTTLGSPANTLSIAFGTTLAISTTGTNVLAKVVSMSTGKINNVSGANSLLGTTTLTGSNTFDIVTSLALGGNIGSSGSLWKTGAGALILTGTNNYTGVTVISAGTLQIGNGGASGTLGSGAVTNNATLTFNRTNDFSVANVISGTGTLNQNGTGVLTLSGNSTYSGSTIINSGTIAVGSDTAIGTSILNFNGNNGAFRSANVSTRTLANSIIFGGSAAILGNAGTGDLIFNGAGVNNGTLTKTLIVSNATTTINNAITNSGAIIKSGPGTLALGGNNTYANTTTVIAGTLRIDSENRLGANPASFNAAHLTLNGGALQSTASFAIDDANRGITLGVNGGTFNVNFGTTLSLQKPMTGSGSLTKSGSGTLLTTVANNFSGATLISAGTLTLSGSGALPNTPTIDVAAASVLDVSGVVGFAIGNSQTLSGLGTINGTAQINGTVSPTGNAGRLAFNNDLLLRGTASLNLNKTGSVLTNDFLAVNGSLSLGGALVVSASGDALSVGDSFKLFSAGVITDTFPSVTLPPLPSSLVWNSSNLAVDGTIRVAVLNPEILPPVLDGTNLLISVQGQTGANYILQSTPSLDAPVIWTGISTNRGNGEVLTISVPVEPNGGQSFFRFAVE